MRELFLSKINNNQYISKKLYENIDKNYKYIIPSNFDLDKYNEEVLNKEYEKYYDYFFNMYNNIDSSIKLDEEQVKAILADEDYSLIIAGAGTGKTTTMASKVKYLVDIKKVDPSKIVVMSYTKKATEELRKRIVVDFNIPAIVTTFHSLGMMHIKEIFINRKCYVLDDNDREKIFFNYFKDNIFPYKDKINDILNIFKVNRDNKNFIFGKHFIDNYSKFDTFDKYFENYKLTKLRENVYLEETVNSIIERDINKEIPITISGELVKSKGEARIANFLYMNSIPYKYEKVYKEYMPDNVTYKPDFTLELGGLEVYVEYFGLSNYKDNYNRYNKIREMKEEYHRKHHTKFIKIDYFEGEDIINTLKNELIKMGFKLINRSYETIYCTMLERNPTSQIFGYKEFLYDVIDCIKSSNKRVNYLNVINNYIDKLPLNEKDLAYKQLYYINDFYCYYQKQLYSTEDYGFDFSDMIYYANLYIENIGNSNKLNFDYLIIDEYQDISQDRYELAKSIADKNNAKVVAVGDDWQSIFSFAGSKIEYIYNFERYFEGAKLLKISKTYRNSQDLIDYSGNFIMKNERQISKKLVSDKIINNPIRFVMFDKDNEYQVLKNLILKIHDNNKKHNIMILGRTNRVINMCFNDPELRDDIGTRIKFLNHEDIEIDGMTIHKSKGLTSDEVIIIGLDSSFPSNKSVFWINCLFRNSIVEEHIPFAEERRLFYVALTRTRNYVYLLVNKDARLRSPFINEIWNIIKKVDEEKNIEML